VRRGILDSSFKTDPLRIVSVLACLAACGIAVDLWILSIPSPAPVIKRQINPNEAGLPALLSLPGIGPAKAQAIVHYRLQQEGTKRPVFTNPQDLSAVPGLGPVTVQRLAPHLTFDVSAPDGQEKVLDPAPDSIMMP
jgi:hypothetical protein